MKLLLKAFLILFIVVACVYAAAPLWLPHILAGQLPAGWRLEELDSGYPGPSGIKVNFLRVKSDSAAFGLAISASDLHFDYRELDTDASLVALDVYMRTAAGGSTDPFTLDELSLPVIRLADTLPRVSVHKMRVAVHYLAGLQTEANIHTRPFVLEFDAFEIEPNKDHGFRLASRVTIAESLRFAGTLELDAQPNLVSALVRFPSDAGPTPWLSLEVQQAGLPAQPTTRIRAILNADLANREWLDSVLAGSTGRLLTQLDGKLEVEADFSGQNRQDFEQLSFASENLQLLAGTGTLDLAGSLLANREGDNIAVNLQSPLNIRYKGDAGWFDQLLTRTVPGLQVTPSAEAVVTSVIDRGSKILLKWEKRPAASFNGDVALDISSGPTRFALNSRALHVEVGDLYKPESIDVKGLVRLNCEVNTGVSLKTGDTELTAQGLSIEAEMRPGDGVLTSTGKATFLNAGSAIPDVSTGKVEMSWEDLDLINLTGNLGVRTYGFLTNLNDERWTGFDFDINHATLGETGATGAGTLMVDGGPEIPFEFLGITGSDLWSIKLPPSTIRLASLRKLLSVAHVTLPGPLKLSGGYIELQGDIQVEDEITARMQLSGHEMLASMHESNVRNANFTFNAGYDREPWASGPVSIEMLELAGGIRLANISAEFDMRSTAQFALKNLYAEVFDGQLDLDTLEILQGSIADTTVEFSNINLAKILAYVDIDGLDGAGFLNVSVPVGRDQAGLHVKNGIFGATGPGRLAYTKKGLAGSNVGLQALENFQFKDLSGTFNYQSDGAYLISVRLDGKNPDLYGGHPIVFNLNINGSLPELFEAMFITGSFEESILKEIKSR